MPRRLPYRNKSNKNGYFKNLQSIAKFKRKASRFRSENVQNYSFVSGVMLSNPSARLEKLRWPVMIVKLRKGHKYSKILKRVKNFNKILLKFNIPVSSLK